MRWTTLNFGRHNGRTLPQILFKDPDWFFWAYEKGVFDRHGPALQSEALRIHARAASIGIPQEEREPPLVESRFFSSADTSVGFELVPATRKPHEGSAVMMRSDHIDMSVPRRQKGYDKLGYWIFLHSLKFCLFGDQRARMTRRRCEAFFDDELNFLWNR